MLPISVLAACYLIIATPLRLLFHIPLHGVVFQIEVLVSVLLLGSILIRWKSRRQGIGSRLRQVFVFLGALPFEILFPALDIHPALILSLRLCNLVHLRDVPELTRRLERWVPGLVPVNRLLVSLAGAALVSHWISCGWIAIGGIDEPGGLLETYTGALYWAITTMATVGYGDIVADTVRERWYAIGVMILGVGIFGYIIGNIATMLANIDRVGAAHRSKLEQIRTHMRYHQFPRPLQHRVEEYYHYMFDHRLGYDDESFMKELPNSLRAEVCVFLHREVLRKVPFLQSAEPKVVERLAFRLKPILYRPHDTIFRRGDNGDRMYFINRGSVEILAPDDKNIVALLQEGSFFGEMALLNLEPRNATARAQGFCELVCLEHAALEEVMRRFPNFADEIHRVANERKGTR